MNTVTRQPMEIKSEHDYHYHRNKHKRNSKRADNNEYTTPQQGESQLREGRRPDITQHYTHPRREVEVNAVASTSKDGCGNNRNEAAKSKN